VATKKPTSAQWAKSLQSNHTDVLELQDSKTVSLDTQFLSRHVISRNQDAITAKLGHQFLRINREAFDYLNIEPKINYTGDEVKIVITASTRIGALPLLSPITYKPELSLIVQPRFGWQGIGPILTTTGWRVLPNILNMPQLRISERRIPPWVLSSVVLHRLDRLLKQLYRRFNMNERYHTKPKGTVNWVDYARGQIPRGQFLKFHCRYPELEESRQLKSFIHFVLKEQKRSLLTQRDHGVHVLQLIELCNHLLQKVNGSTPQRPNQLQLEQMHTGFIKANIIRQGLDAITWTVEEKGLAGLGDLNGLPWMMNMEELFESYVESIIDNIVKRRGGRLLSGRERETIIPISWDPPFIGSQSSLVPDILIERDKEIFIIDAKYKDHWEDLNIDGWYNMKEKLKERHRNDLLQVLAYASIPDHKEINCCLIYPCRIKTWESLIERNRHIHSAVINRGRRQINLSLMAIPFTNKEDYLDQIESIFY